MGYSGLIYAAIVAAWAAFLVPRWVRRHEEIEQAAETDTVRGVRVLQRRNAPTVRSGHARPTSATVLHGRAEGLVIGAAGDADLGDPVDGADASTQNLKHDHSADRLRVPDPVAEIDAAFAAAARRRSRLLIVLLVALVGAVMARVVGSAPLVAPIVVGGLLLLFLVVARRAAVAQAARRRLAVRRAAALADRLSAPGAGDGDDGLTADGKRIAVYEPPEVAEVDPDAWDPVEVPRPTYLDKAVAPAPRARSINLQAPGAWTSGRLDPAGSIELPPQRRQPVAAPSPAEHDEAEADESGYPEHRRAVGD